MTGNNDTPLTPELSDYEQRKQDEISLEAWQSRRVSEIAQMLVDECANTWRWGNSDGGFIISTIYAAFEAADLRNDPQIYTYGTCGCGNPAPMEDEIGQTLYRFYNRGGELLYVGVAENPFKRWQQHSKDKAWFGEVSRFETDWFPTRESVLAAERRAIKIESPKYNIIHSEAGCK